MKKFQKEEEKKINKQKRKGKKGKRKKNKKITLDSLSTAQCNTFPYFEHSSATSSWISKCQSGPDSVAGSNIFFNKIVLFGATT